MRDVICESTILWSRMQNMQQNIQQFQADAAQNIRKKEIDLLQPITEKAKTAILKDKKVWKQFW